MANTISIQDVLSVFKRFSAELLLEEPRVNFGPWVILLNKSDPDRPDEAVSGTISYPKDLLSEDRRGEIVVSMKIGKSATFRKTYSAKFDEGWLSRGYVVQTEMRIVLDFVRETDKPLREKLREHNRKLDRQETTRLDKKKSDTEAEAAESLRKLMR